MSDDHTHFLSGGFQLASVDQRDAATPQAFATRIGTCAHALTKGRWITGGDWDHELWPGAPLPGREWIDSITPRNPVAVNRLDGHLLLANATDCDSPASRATRPTRRVARSCVTRVPASRPGNGCATM